ncbi:1-acyl-sn-glycerol-3-phosphate acyltransferase [Tabrizicola oligotrophica]|uniref:Glycerol-3-phosphate acyltransferase n=1 Tax=Tabrizicola oligotrophica TaxID=2710650 RepID=A0A6M0QTW9_9RHOB|nr:1-acyl-sn-glycerol-3-phosphate acyltransferase [Tabrizicola oligotrophica]NEY90930.1 glycerol-3-phosphate acyltransferase [Tabrizicola oligotrophica]
MFREVALPFWLLVLIVGFAAVTFASHFLFPSVRWFFRKRAERALAQLNARLDRPIEWFKLARRQDMIVRLAYDPKVMAAVADHAVEAGIPGEVAFEEARHYAREIVPGFSATLYFGVATRLARWISRGLYRVRIGKVDPALTSGLDRKATVIFVMNHRSNMDYVLVTWLVANRSALSYAVGEWARVWPLSRLIRAMGAYFIRRGSRNTLYRRVLARYVQMATEEGTTQAIFPEGGLSLDGRVGQAKMGLLNYIVTGAGLGRDVLFVPVGIAYDRVLEDRVLIRAGQAGERRFRAGIGAILRFVLVNLWRRLRGRFKGFGTAAAGFGPPLSLRAFMAANPEAPTEVLGAHLMAEIEKVVPVLPVPLVAAALESQPADRAALADRMAALAAALDGAGAVLKLPPQGLAQALDEGLAPLLGRGLVGEDLRPSAGSAPVLAFYAAPIWQRLEAGLPAGAALRRT